MIELFEVMLPSYLSEVILSSGDLGGEFLGFSIVPSSVREVSLFVERTGLVVAELVILH